MIITTSMENLWWKLSLFVSHFCLCHFLELLSYICEADMLYWISHRMYLSYNNVSFVVALIIWLLCRFCCYIDYAAASLLKITLEFYILLDVLLWADYSIILFVFLSDFYFVVLCGKYEYYTNHICRRCNLSKLIVKFLSNLRTPVYLVTQVDFHDYDITWDNR